MQRHATGCRCSGSRWRSDRRSSRASAHVEAGVADRVEIRVADYRELIGEPFDAIASIGMVEHVGEERIDLYAARLASMLRPGGRLLNHGIAKLRDFDTSDEGPFSERFVFPDGVPLPLSRIELALERAGMVTTHVEGFAGDYAQTTEPVDRPLRAALRGCRAPRRRGARACLAVVLARRAAGFPDWLGVGVPGARAP